MFAGCLYEKRFHKLYIEGQHINPALEASLYQSTLNFNLQSWDCHVHVTLTVDPSRFSQLLTWLKMLLQPNKGENCDEALYK